MFKDSPIIGVGLNNFPVVFLQRFGGVPGMSGLANSHTAFVTIAAEMGIIGLILTVLVFYQSYRVFRDVRRNPLLEPYAFATWMGILVILAMSQSEGRLLEDANLWLFMAVLIALKHLSRQIGTDENTAY
jgi:O-antigen ligase